MPKSDIEQTFPGLAGSGFGITSPPDPAYNCVAWAGGETHRWWDSSGEGGYYWPSGVPPAESIPNLTAALATLGYQPCDDPHPESEYEKLAIYADEHGWPTHVARQVPSGAWTSKLGSLEDIEHATLEGLQGVLYGKAVQFLRRRRVPPS